ncbi:MAG: serine protease [Spirochaetia bacterium]
MRKIQVIGFLILILASGFPGVARADTGPTRLLSLDHSVAGTVVVGGERQATTYRLTIRDDIFAIRVELNDAAADLDLFLSDGRGELIAFSELADYNESIYLSRVTEPALVSGRFTLEVIYQYDRSPIADGRELTEIPYRLLVESIRLEPLATLRPGRQVTGRLLASNAMAALYRIIVPDTAEYLRLDISETDADVDLFLFHGTVSADPFMADHLAQTLRSTESIVIDRSSSPPLRTGTYYLLVIDQVTLEYEAGFRLSVSDAEDAPSHLRGTPSLPEVSSDLDRVLLATVEVLTGSGGGGSGSLLSASGIVLTNWHVVRADDGRPDTDITIGLSLDHARPPVELFRAEVIEHSEERDLALLRITGDRYGLPLEPGFELPYVDLRDGATAIGDELRFVGYPGIGGTGSRASITYTTGVVAGFQQTAYGYFIKTDGEINSGSSGGAALDSSFRLVGVPASIVGEESGQLAYVVPVTAIPESWMRHLR